MPDNSVIIRILTISHLGLAAHLVADSLLALIKPLFWWPGDMKQDIMLFVSQCLHCLRTKDKVNPRPFGDVIHANKPNKVLHYDILFISKAKGECHHHFQYILVLKDDFSGFIELINCETADHLAVAAALIDWFKRFGICLSARVRSRNTF